MNGRFTLNWEPRAKNQFEQLEAAALRSFNARQETGRTKSSRQEGLYDQVVKCLSLLESNPRHPGLQTHVFTSIEHPFKAGEKVFEAYAQNRTPSAYRVFWCYGPGRGEIRIIAITSHP